MHLAIEASSQAFHSNNLKVTTEMKMNIFRNLNWQGGGEGSNQLAKELTPEDKSSRWAERDLNPEQPYPIPRAP